MSTNFCTRSSAYLPDILPKMIAVGILSFTLIVFAASMAVFLCRRHCSSNRDQCETGNCQPNATELYPVDIDLPPPYWSLFTLSGDPMPSADGR